MLHEWIKAPLALAYLSDRPNDDAAKRRICERAQGGLLPAKADRMVWREREERDHIIGKSFWAVEWDVSLKQDWEAGDFSVLIDQSVEVQAFGVSFDFDALSDLVPSDRKAEALRRISVSGHAEWVSAASTHAAVMAMGNALDATAVIAEACRLGLLGARAMRATCERRKGDYIPAWAAIEWDVPRWFWRDFTDLRKGIFQWHLGRVRGDGRRDGELQRIHLQGVHFHKSGLINLGLEATPTEATPTADAVRGRRAKYDWPAASLHIFGLINRGEFKPECQADIEKALIDHLADGDNAPGESTVRPYAKMIWEENLKA